MKADLIQRLRAVGSIRVSHSHFSGIADLCDQAATALAAAGTPDVTWLDLWLRDEEIAIRKSCELGVYDILSTAGYVDGLRNLRREIERRKSLPAAPSPDTGAPQEET